MSFVEASKRLSATSLMHFVKKVPTSDEQKAAKNKERAVKLKIYCKTKEQILQKRQNGTFAADSSLVE